MYIPLIILCIICNVQSYSFFSKHDLQCSHSQQENKTVNNQSSFLPLTLFIPYVMTEKDNHISQNKCSKNEMKPKLVINQFNNSRALLSNKFVGSMCLNCATCLSVAQKLNKVTKSKFSKCMNKFENEDLNADQLHYHLERTCKEDFRNYDLREYNGHLMIIESSKKTIHVASPMDGKWTKKLRNTCSKLLQNMDLNFILYQTKWNNLNFVDYLCSGDGMFRDCKNINYYAENIPIGSRIVKTKCVDCNSQ